MKISVIKKPEDFIKQSRPEDIMAHVKDSYENKNVDTEIDVADSSFDMEFDK